jgi:hypothetical protein
MKSIGNKPTIRSINGFNSALALLVLVLSGVGSSATATRNLNPGIVPAEARPYGKTLGEWSAIWWNVGIEHPVEGNPFFEGGAFELSSTVWGIAAPLGEGTFSTTVPAGKALFLPLVTIECSSLEPEESGFHGDTEAEQAECAAFWTDHIVDLSFEIDGVPIQNLEAYRVVSPQFSFVAPDPNILGVPGGGAGTAVADGYYLMLPPLSKGVHTTRLRGTLHFSVAEGDPFDLELVTDNTFSITIE